MVHQLGLPTFIVISTSIERLWDFFIKNLHTLHVSKLNLPNKIKNLQLVHITKLIQINLVTCTRYITTINKKFRKLIAKNLYIYIYIYI
jgi:hypothetical protein